MTVWSSAIIWRTSSLRTRCIVELKAVKAFDDVHFAQCINYLKATGMKICLLINFGQPKIEIKRFVN